MKIGFVNSRITHPPTYKPSKCGPSVAPTSPFSLHTLSPGVLWLTPLCIKVCSYSYAIRKETLRGIVIFNWFFLLALSEESSKLISEAVSILPSVPGLCTPEASVNVLPSVLYLLTCALREVASIKDSSSQKTVSAVLQALKQLTTSPFILHHKCSKDWIDLLQRFNFFFLV